MTCPFGEVYCTLVLGRLQGQRRCPVPSSDEGSPAVVEHRAPEVAGIRRKAAHLANAGDRIGITGTVPRPARTSVRGQVECLTLAAPAHPDVRVAGIASSTVTDQRHTWLELSDLAVMQSGTEDPHPACLDANGRVRRWGRRSPGNPRPAAGSPAPGVGPECRMRTATGTIRRTHQDSDRFRLAGIW